MEAEGDGRRDRAILSRAGVDLLVAVHLVRHSRWIASLAAGRLLGDAASRRRTWAALALTTFAFLAIAAGSLLSGGEGANGHGHESHRRAVHVER